MHQIATAQDQPATTPASWVETAKSSTSTASPTNTLHSSPTATSKSTPVSLATALLAVRTRDFTWIRPIPRPPLQFSHSFSLSATKSPTWNSETDHLDFTYDGSSILLPTGHLSTWTSPHDNNVKVERTLDKNSVIVSFPDLAEILVKEVPVTKQDDRIHNYKVPADDCFVHLEVQFRFVGLSDKVEGVLGRMDCSSGMMSSGNGIVCKK